MRCLLVPASTSRQHPHPSVEPHHPASLHNHRASCAFYGCFKFSYKTGGWKKVALKIQSFFFIFSQAKHDNPIFFDISFENSISDVLKVCLCSFFFFTMQEAPPPHTPLLLPDLGHTPWHELPPTCLSHPNRYLSCLLGLEKKHPNADV